MIRVLIRLPSYHKNSTPMDSEWYFGGCIDLDYSLKNLEIAT